MAKTTVCVVSDGGVLGGTRSRKCTIPTFGVRGLRALRMIIRDTTRLHSPIVLTKAPNACHCNNIKDLVSLMRSLTHRCGLPLILRLSRRRRDSSVFGGIHTKVHSIVVSNSRLPFRSGVTQIRRIAAFYRHFSIDIRTRLKHLNNRRSSLQISRGSSTCASPTTTTRFIRHARVSSLTMTVNATRNLCTRRPQLSFIQLRRVHRQIRVPLILRNTSNLSRRSIRRYVHHNVYGIGITARLGVTFTSTLGKCFCGGPTTGSPHRCVRPTGTTVGRIMAHVVNIYNDRKGVWSIMPCGGGRSYL